MADSNGERSHERPQLDHCCLRYAERLLVDEDRHLIELAWSREHPRQRPLGVLEPRGGLATTVCVPTALVELLVLAALPRHLRSAVGPIPVNRARRRRS
jgi:hypothetical protein